MTDALFFLVVLCLYAVAGRYPGAACGYVLAGTALEQCAQALVPVANRQDTLCNYLTAGAVVVGLVARVVQDRGSLPPLRQASLWVLGLLAYCYLTAAWSIFPSTTIAALNRAVPYLATFVGMAPLLIRSDKDLKDCLVALSLCTLVALTLLLVFAEWGSRGVVLPGKGFESNPLALAESAGCLLIVTAFAPLRLGRSALLRFLLPALALAVTAMVFLRTASRGQVLASLAATLAFSVRHRGGGIAIFALGICGLVAYAVLPEEMAKHAQRWEPAQMRDAIGLGRIHEAQRLLSFWSHGSISEHIFGLGHAASQDPRLLGNYPHVVPAEVLAEEGIVGALLFSATIVVSALGHYRGLRDADSRSRSVLSATAALLCFEFVLIWKQGSLLGASPFLLLLTMAPEQRSQLPIRDARSSVPARSRAFAASTYHPPRLRTRAR